MGLRSAVAQQQGMDEELVAKVGDYERTDLTERHKVALRLADAYIIGMGQVSPELARQARREYTDVELVDIGVMLFRASANKVRVALATDHEDVRLRHLDED
jgi:alkylhydroperoxidase family enzyme